MRVRMLKAVTAYWNYEVRTFQPDEEFDGDLARHLAGNAAKGSVEVLEGDPEPEPEPEVDEGAGSDGEATSEGQGADVGDDAELPVDGTAADILAWVGDDPDRAAEALDVEEARDKPRSTLVKQLAKLAEGGQ